MDITVSQITYTDFKRIDLRVGKIIQVEEFPKARKAAYKLLIDFGAIGTKKSSAQITKLYSKGDLIGKLVIAVVNFPPRQVADFLSEVLTLGVVLDNDKVVLLEPDRDVPPGARIL